MQAKGIVESLAADSFETEAEVEIIALIAYLQRLGTDIKVNK
jgi:cytochrome c oxidase cbb3-type subunit I/II